MLDSASDPQRYKEKLMLIINGSQRLIIFAIVLANVKGTVGGAGAKAYCHGTFHIAFFYF